MKVNDIHDLLKNVFPDFKVQLLDRSTWSKIYVGDSLKNENFEVYTYSGYPDREDNIWYCNLKLGSYTKEVMIPNKNTKEFLQIYRDIYLDSIKAKKILDSVSDRLSNIDYLEIRDKKIDNLIN